MNKHFTIDLPLNSKPIKQLAEINKAIGIKLFAGIPDSPLNGGRNNFLLDKQKVFGRLTVGVNKGQLSAALQKFYENIDLANANGIPFYVAITNMFVSQEELNDKNLHPIQRLIESGQKHGIKNGIIVNNQLLEDHIRQKYGNQLVFTSSCTKYVVPEKILSPAETLKMYLEDIKKYDYVVLTPQDSRREKVIQKLMQECPQKIVTISNTYCYNSCNCYDHYEFLSQENKTSLVDLKTGDVLVRSLLFAVPRLTNCPLATAAFTKIDYKPIAQMQLACGVTNFKIGRGLGENFFNDLVEMIRNAQ